jgi:D-alanyl-D-alanine carboxypeptidase
LNIASEKSLQWEKGGFMPNKSTAMAACQKILLFTACFLAILVGCLSPEGPCYAAPEQQIADNEQASLAPEEYVCPSAEIEVNDGIARAGLLYDMSSHKIVWEKNKNQAYPIASLTKMMVALLAMEDISEGKVNKETQVRITPQAARMNGSKVYLRTGCHVTVEELLKAAMISSGNDAAYLLAQFLGGTESAFVDRMNRRASELGMRNTFYSNSTGMPAPNKANDNRSSPSDLLILSRQMLNYNELRDISGTSHDVITQDERIIRLRNHNGLVHTYDEVDGFKTGFTLNAKYCLVATSNKNGRRLISIVLGAPSISGRNRMVANMLCRYYQALGMGSLGTGKTGHSAACSVKKAAKTAFRPRNAYAKDDAVNGLVIYRVKKGDSLYRIAASHGCSVAYLKAWNRLRRNSIIMPGQQLKIPRKTLPKKNLENSEVALAVQSDAKQHTAVQNLGEKAPRQCQKSKSATTYFYKVRPGDTLWQISRKYEGVSVRQIMQTNGLRRVKDLKPGITLKIIEWKAEPC